MVYHMGKKIVKSIKNVATATRQLLSQRFVRDNPNAAAVTAASVADGTHKNSRGRYSGYGVGQFQNWVFAANRVDMLTHDEIAAAFTVEFPRSSVVVRNGGTFPTGKNGSFIDGILTSYNAGRHGNPVPSKPTPRFAIVNGERRNKNAPPKN
jgi:hypothetical protein